MWSLDEEIRQFKKCPHRYRIADVISKLERTTDWKRRELFVRGIADTREATCLYATMLSAAACGKWEERSRCARSCRCHNGEFTGRTANGVMFGAWRSAKGCGKGPAEGYRAGPEQETSPGGPTPCIGGTSPCPHGGLWWSGRLFFPRSASGS